MNEGRLYTQEDSTQNPDSASREREEQFLHLGKVGRAQSSGRIPSADQVSQSKNQTNEKDH